MATSSCPVQNEESGDVPPWAIRKPPNLHDDVKVNGKLSPKNTFQNKQISNGPLRHNVGLSNFRDSFRREPPNTWADDWTTIKKDLDQLWQVKNLLNEDCYCPEGAVEQSVEQLPETVMTRHSVIGRESWKVEEFEEGKPSGELTRKRTVALKGKPKRAWKTGSPRMLHVSGQSPVKQVAGAISWISREGECPRILATLSSAVNQAAKAVAIARKYLEEDHIDICCYPMFTPGRRRQDDSFIFILRKGSLRVGSISDDNTQELKISKASNPGTVAGAIAARVREGQRVFLSSIGPRSVSKAICSIVISRQYLKEDGVDICFRPSFMNIEFDDGRRSSCLQFQLLAQQI